MNGDSRRNRGYTNGDLRGILHNLNGDLRRNRVYMNGDLGYTIS